MNEQPAGASKESSLKSVGLIVVLSLALTSLFMSDTWKGTGAKVAPYRARVNAGQAAHLLKALRVAQFAAVSEYDRYLAAPPTPDVSQLGPEPVPWQLRPCEGCNWRRPSSCYSFECIPFRPHEDVYYSLACTASNDARTVTCAALGDLDGDGQYALFVFRIVPKGARRRSVPAPVPDFGGLAPACDRYAKINEVVNCTPHRL